MYTTRAQAKHAAKDYLHCSTLVVGENGDIHANCNIDEICTEHEKKEEKFFILKGERIVKKAPAKQKDK